MSEADAFANFVLRFVGMILLGIAGLLVASFVTMLAWNWSMPHLFALPEATYRSAAGLTILAWSMRLVSVTHSKEG